MPTLGFGAQTQQQLICCEGLQACMPARGRSSLLRWLLAVSTTGSECSICLIVSAAFTMVSQQPVGCQQAAVLLWVAAGHSLQGCQAMLAPMKALMDGWSPSQLCSPQSLAALPPP